MKNQKLNGTKVNMALFRYKGQLGKYIAYTKEQIDTYLTRAGEILESPLEIIDTYQGIEAQIPIFNRKFNELKTQDPNETTINIRDFINS